MEEEWKENRHKNSKGLHVNSDLFSELIIRELGISSQGNTL